MGNPCRLLKFGDSFSSYLDLFKWLHSSPFRWTWRSAVVVPVVPPVVVPVVSPVVVPVVSPVAMLLVVVPVAPPVVSSVPFPSSYQVSFPLLVPSCSHFERPSIFSKSPSPECSRRIRDVKVEPGRDLVNWLLLFVNL